DSLVGVPGGGAAPAAAVQHEPAAEHQHGEDRHDEPGLAGEVAQAAHVVLPAPVPAPPVVPVPPPPRRPPNPPKPTPASPRTTDWAVRVSPSDWPMTRTVSPLARSDSLMSLVSTMLVLPDVVTLTVSPAMVLTVSVDPSTWVMVPAAKPPPPANGPPWPPPK